LQIFCNFVQNAQPAFIMLYQLSSSQEKDLLNLPETGMGYQIVEATRQGSYRNEKLIVLNSEIVIELDGTEAVNIRNVIHEGITSVKSRIHFIALNRMTVLNEQQFRSLIKEPKNENER
jgi:hypothetical protein